MFGFKRRIEKQLNWTQLHTTKTHLGRATSNAKIPQSRLCNNGAKRNRHHVLHSRACRDCTWCSMYLLVCEWWTEDSNPSAHEGASSRGQSIGTICASRLSNETRADSCRGVRQGGYNLPSYYCRAYSITRDGHTKRAPHLTEQLRKSIGLHFLHV